MVLAIKEKLVLLYQPKKVNQIKHLMQYNFILYIYNVYILRSLKFVADKDTVEIRLKHEGSQNIL